MVKKLKTKIISLARFKFIVLAVPAILAVAFSLSVNKAYASQDIPANTVKATLSVNDNFFRISKTGTANVKVSLTLVSPDAIKMGKDPSVSDTLSRGAAGDPIIGIQIGVLNKAQNDSLCKSISSALGAVINSQIYHCDFTYSTSNWPNWSVSQALGVLTTWQKGQTLTFDVALSQSDLQKMGLKYGDQGELNELYFYTNFYLFGIANNTAFTPAKSVFIQGYNTDQQVTDAKNLPRPVDQNGSVTTSPNQTPGNSLAGSVASIINEIIGVLLGFLQELVYGLFYWLIAPLIQAMLSIRVYTDTFVAVIYPGWEVIRNICNIFFIVALMVIALATLFRVDSYKTRPLLIQLILAALMINFSLVIAQAILALADTIQAQFLPANVTVIRSLAGDLMVGTYRDLYGTKAFADASFAGIIKPLFFLAMSLGSFAVFAAIAIFLVIRIVALWLLLLISPIAYACGVLPSTAQYRKTWWDTFLKYAFFTPIMAFFLNLTAVISNQFKDIPILQTVADPTLVKELGNSDLAGFVFKVASNLLLLVFLFAALQVADKAGIYGASGITKIAEKGIFAPFALSGMGLKKLGGFTAQKIQKNTGIELRPTEWKHAWEKYSKKRIEEDKQIGGELAESRRHSKSWFSQEVLAKLGSPEDAFRTFLNPHEWGRMVKGGQTRALRAYHKAEHIDEEINGKDGIGGLISDTEKKQIEKNKKELESLIAENQNDLSSGELNLDSSTDTGKANVESMDKFIILLQDKIRQLRADGDEAGSKALAADLQKFKKDRASGVKIMRLSDYSAGGLDMELKGFVDEEDADSKIRVSKMGENLKKTVVSDAMLSAKKAEMLEARREGDEFRSPENYEHRLERLHLESEESGKLRGIDNAEQLYALLVEAIRGKNKFRAAAIMKKMAEDYNDNEFLNLTIKPGTNGLSYGSGSRGMLDYMNDVMIGQLGMDEQSALQLVDEISYVNEKKNHWENARNVGYKNGQLNYATEQEHTIAAMVEITKRGPRDVAREFNRLAIGAEIQHPDGHREFELSSLGIAFAKIVGTQLHQANQMGFMTGSLLRRFSEPQNIDRLRKNGVSEAVLQDIISRAKSTNLDPIDVIKNQI
ncbi:MAG: hypothetical protein WC794_04975 [Candidatus Doudnabacteria bacterium]